MLCYISQAWGTLSLACQLLLGVSPPLLTSKSSSFFIFVRSCARNPLDTWDRMALSGSPFATLGLSFSTCFMELVPNPACFTNNCKRGKNVMDGEHNCLGF